MIYAADSDSRILAAVNSVLPPLDVLRRRTPF